jgi:L-threonylcarbamoyladenylate synthase
MKRIIPADPPGIDRAAQSILEGKIIAFPTETFYGLGARAFQVEAVQRIFAIKGREERNPILILVASRDWVPRLARKIPPRAQILMKHFWPGPLTLVFEASQSIPAVITAGTGKVGIRLTSHPVARGLIQRVGEAITGTSANRSGEPSCQTAEEVWKALGERIDGILDGGKTMGGVGSTVLDITSDPPRIIREGAIPRSELDPFLFSF